MTTAPTTVCIIGGGLSGLTLGFLLQRRGVDVQVLESNARTGGNIRSERVDGYLCEWGPAGFLDNAPTSFDLIRALGIEDKVIVADEAAATRWIVRQGKLRKLPTSPTDFLFGDVLSLGGKMRLLLEDTRPARRGGPEESVFDFAQRRIGREAAEVLIDAMVAGIYSGDAKQLSLQCAFPRMVELEQKYGGLFKAMRALKRERKGNAKPAPAGAFGGKLHSFSQGMETWPHALAEQLGEALQLSTPVRDIEYKKPLWQVHTEAGETLTASHLVLATPAWASAPLIHSVHADLALDLAAIPSAPVAVVCLGFSKSELQNLPPGFGFLVPSREPVPVLGVLFEDCVFENRAPRGKALFRVMMGGARDRTAVQQTDEHLVERAAQALRQLLGVHAGAEMVRVIRHKRGIPQYNMGHEARLKRLATHCDALPGLHLIGYSYHGIAMNACVQEATKLAQDLGN